MQVHIRVNAEKVMDLLGVLGQNRQGPFVLSRGLNLLAKAVQGAVRNDVGSSLRFARKDWVLRQISIRSGTWATKTRLTVRVEVLDKADFLAALEQGGPHIPQGQFMVMPNPKVFGTNRIVMPTNPLKITNLNFRETPFGTQGDNRTFIIHTDKGTPLVMQRVGPDAKGRNRRGINRSTGLRLLYALIQHSHRDKKIHWAEVASRTVSIEEDGIFTRVIRDALATARK